MDEFKKYCLETARTYVRLYSWYKMSPSMHKVLIHGCNIIKELGPPMGYFSEEPQEGGNKVFRSARVEHSRLYRRSLTNQDTMNHLFILSAIGVGYPRISEENKSK